MGRDSGGDTGPGITYRDIPGYPDYQLEWTMMVGYRIVKRQNKEPVSDWWYDDGSAAALMLGLLEQLNAN